MPLAFGEDPTPQTVQHIERSSLKHPQSSGGGANVAAGRVKGCTRELARESAACHWLWDQGSVDQSGLWQCFLVQIQVASTSPADFDAYVAYVSLNQNSIGAIRSGQFERKECDAMQYHASQKMV